MACGSQAGAQLEDLINPGGADAAKESSAIEIRSQLGKWKAEVEADLARLGKFSQPEQLPPGITPTDLSARRRLLEQTQLAISRHLMTLDEIKESKAALEAAQAESDAWKGFGNEAPISILTVDELENRREALEEKQASARSSVDVFETTLAGLLAESKEAEKATAAALKAYEGSGKADPAALWKLESARGLQRSLFIRASALQYRIASLKDVLLGGETELALLSRKIREASKAAVFSEDDMKRIKAASADRQAELRKEIADVRKRQAKAAADQSSAAAALAKLKGEASPDAAALELAELNMETAEARLDTLQMMIDSLGSFSQIEAFVPEAYEDRLRLMRAKTPEERKAALDSLVALNRRLNAWEVVAKNQLASVAADINKEQSRASTFPSDDPRLAPLNRVRAILWENQALIQRAYQGVSGQRRVLSRWIEEYESKEKSPWYSPVTAALGSTWNAVQRVWGIPVNRYEETIEIDGQKVVQTRFVSLGSIITALILFIIAYLIASRISSRLQRLFVERHLIGENQARTIRNWIMLVVALLLALATLSWLSIPLTIFAFLAGALAIGVGFGTQTIIKNFISGIILLFERKVRVGDIIEVDGINGVVSEINTRSSIIRGFNGIENLIPNSLFLENRVVNWTLNSRLLRRELKIGVSYGTQPQDVIKILVESANRHGLVIKDPAPLAVFSNFGENSLDFTLLFWIELNDKTNGLVVDSDLRMMIEKRFEESDIGIPHPQRDMHLSTDKPLQVEIVRETEQVAEKSNPEEKKPSLP